ncbi:methyltransferase domain-containing protein [Acrocarpospora catenulata]|uniref:methyltransferase domain-containing protein n=1 Tax=Acrocarpospora catenulata TaxID=2836182 RepID=UPI002023B1F5|nr:methyltransferase domain-containing protein [Acrocarpospora catenulata]
MKSESRTPAETRAFFAERAGTWEEKYPDDEPAFATAVAALALAPGSLVVDAGCGTARAFPLLRAAVGPEGRVLGVDLTPEMIQSARDRGRGALGGLVIGDAGRLPLPDGVAAGVLAAGLISHVPDSGELLWELARVTMPGGRLAVFHPVGRAVLAARHGRELSPSDVRAEENLRPLLHRAGWALLDFHDADDRYLAVAERVTG